MSCSVSSIRSIDNSPSEKISTSNQSINDPMINPCPSHDLYSEMNFSDLLIPFRLRLHNNQRALISQSLLSRYHIEIK